MWLEAIRTSPFSKPRTLREVDVLLKCWQSISKGIDFPQTYLITFFSTVISNTNLHDSVIAIDIYLISQQHNKTFKKAK